MIDTSPPMRFAFFDVDGTVIEKDSFRIIIRERIFTHSVFRTFLATFLLSVLGILWLLRMVDKTQFKSALLWAATVGLSRRESLKTLRQIVDKKVKSLWFEQMKAELKELRENGYRICYISASGEPWLRALLNQMDPHEKLIVGSKLTYFMGGLTLKGPNCIGPEKIRRLNQILPKDIIWEIAYSDHRADIPLLLACSKRVVVNPTAKSKAAITSALGADNFKLVHWTASPLPRPLD